MTTRRQFLAGTAMVAGISVVRAVPAYAWHFAMEKGVIYTDDQPGMWKGKQNSHVPIVDTKGLDVVVTTPHPMSEQHYIVRHTIVAEDGEVVHAKTFNWKDDPVSKAVLKKKGKYVATSFCNLHDMWVKEFML
ncbi:desulfoferrodoxin family protein [Halodesulfovibrio aestuarii]|uniref:Superoxide reductase n=1 Tax=Halodesulfovibrio aestuarii TaxID=126333 RepID=A0A8G2C955_9BACT|nr:desulfoferrodoxin family protein [Halodesulfovibrio aestuarii]SHJ04085.1 superoxide reductase [Halodesulfovibrio aestuarii]